jgi:hypothetical protein
MMERLERQDKIPQPQRSGTIALLVVVAVVAIIVEWIGLGTLAKYLLWTAGIIAVILGAYFSFLRYR